MKVRFCYPGNDYISAAPPMPDGFVSVKKPPRNFDGALTVR